MRALVLSFLTSFLVCLIMTVFEIGILGSSIEMNQSTVTQSITNTDAQMNGLLPHLWLRHIKYPYPGHEISQDLVEEAYSLFWLKIFIERLPSKLLSFSIFFVCLLVACRSKVFLDRIVRVITILGLGVLASVIHVFRHHGASSFGFETTQLVILCEFLSSEMILPLAIVILVCIFTEVFITFQKQSPSKVKPDKKLSDPAITDSNELFGSQWEKPYKGA